MTYLVSPILQEIFYFQTVCTKSVLYLVYGIYCKFLFSMCKEDYRTDLSKHVSINTQIDHNGVLSVQNLLFYI